MKYYIKKIFNINLKILGKGAIKNNMMISLMIIINIKDCHIFRMLDHPKVILLIRKLMSIIGINSL